MILCRLRARAGIYASAMLLFAGMALTARATQAVAESQMHEYVLGTIGAAGIVVFGAFWILLTTLSGRSERALLASIVRLENAVQDFAEKLEKHDASPQAHYAASTHNHKPMDDKIEAVRAEMHEFVEWCRTHQCVGLPRDPGGSPHPRRKDDSGTDYTALRGPR